MGREATCVVRRSGEQAESKVLLESDEIVVRGALRIRIPFAAITAVSAKGGVLHISMKRGATVTVIGSAPQDFLRELAAAGVTVATGRAQRGNAIVFLVTDAPASLDKLSSLAERIAPDGAIWVVHPRGRKDFADTHVFAAAKAAGLVDVKVARFSDTHTAEKLVIPLASRKG